MSKHMIFNSDGMSLRFDNDEDYEQYQKELLDLQMKYYNREVLNHGIHAGNQDIYVQREEELNDWDSKYMYNEYKKWLKNNNIK